MTEQQKISYALGMNIMGNLAELPIEIDVESVISAIKDVSAEKETALKVEEYHKYMQEFQKKVQEAGQQAVAKAAENNKKAGAEFLAENAKKRASKSLLPVCSTASSPKAAEPNPPPPARSKSTTPVNSPTEPSSTAPSSAANPSTSPSIRSSPAGPKASSS